MDRNKEPSQHEAATVHTRPAAYMLWFTLGYVVAGASALAVVLVVGAPELLVSWWVLLALAAAGGVGLVLSDGLRRDLQLAEQTLDRVLQGVPLAELPVSNRRPTAGLLARVAALAERERRFGQLREQWGRQAGAAAARPARFDQTAAVHHQRQRGRRAGALGT
jgi:hypothetical protein